MMSSSQDKLNEGTPIGNNSDKPKNLAKDNENKTKSDEGMQKEMLNRPQNGNLRNPITGIGVEIFHGKQRVNLQKGGNPVTGEGYSNDSEQSNAPRLNGAKDKIIKNQVPPGGFSTGLW